MFCARRLSVFLCVAVAACSSEPEPNDNTDPKGARILEFSANPTSIRVGETTTLTWETSGVAGVNIEPQVGLQPPSGSIEIKPFATTQYVLQIESAAGPLKSTVTVEVQGGPPSIDAFTATPQTVMPGESAVLEWATSNADQVIIEPNIGAQPARGSVTVTPDTTTNYRLNAIGPEGSTTGEVRVVVASGNQPFVLSFSASPQTVAPGEPVTLSWNTTNSESVTIDNQVGIQPTMGTTTVMPTETTTYNLTAVGPGGQASATVTVNVVLGGDPSILRFIAMPSTVPVGGQVLLDWETDNATHVTVSDVAGTLMAKGSTMVTVQATRSFTLTAFGNGKMVTQDVTVTVAAPDDPVVLEFSASPQAVLAGGTTTLSWRTQNVASVNIDNNVGMNLMPDGTVQVAPTQSTTYTLTARGNNGNTVTQTLQVNVQAAMPTVLSFVAQPPSIVAGQMTTITWATTGATGVVIDQNVGQQGPNGSIQVSPSTTTLYTLTASGPGGQATALLTVTVGAQGAPSISMFTASPQQTAPGGMVTLAWMTTGATQVSIDNGLGTQPTNGQISVSPAQTTTYTLIATGPGGMSDAQITVNVVSTNGDQCSNAFVINQSGQFTGNTQTALNDYDPGQGGCTRFFARGPDVAYQISLQAGDRLVATLNPTGTSWDASLYLVRNCGDISASCVAGQDNGNPEQIDFTAAAAGDYFLIVDGFRTGGAYMLDVQLNTAPIPNDTCMNAIDATAGGTFTGTTRGATNDYDPGAGGCARFVERSGDVAYVVNLNAGERLQADLTTSWDSAIYVVTDCSQVRTTCVAGQDDGNPEQVDFVAQTTAPHFIIVDGYETAAGNYSLSVNISPPVQGGDQCNNAVPIPTGGGSFQSDTTGLTNDYEPNVACTGFQQRGPDQVYAVNLAVGDVVEALAEFEANHDGAMYVLTDCSAATTSCVAGADSGARGVAEEIRFVARNPGLHYVIMDAVGPTWDGAHDLTVTQYNGDVCADAAPLRLDNTPEWTTTVGATNDYSPNAGGCTGFSANAADRAFRVRLNAGDQLQATVTPETGYDPSIYLVTDCGDINGSCVAGRDRIGNNAETLLAVVQQSGEYFLILDGFNASTGAGTLTATIARGDTCGDAYQVAPGGGTYRGTTTGYGTDYGIDVRTGSCTGWPQAGPDAVYAVALGAGQRLQATLATSWDSSLYLITDCGQSATSCVAGEDNGQPESIDYTNPTGAAQQLFLVVDSWLTTVSGNYSLDITIN